MQKGGVIMDVMNADRQKLQKHQVQLRLWLLTGSSDIRAVGAPMKGIEISKLTAAERISDREW